MTAGSRNKAKKSRNPPGDSFDFSTRKLQAGRIDLFAFSVPSTRYLMIRMGIDPDNYESVYTLKQADLYYAFHNDTEEQLIQALNTTLQELKQADTTGKSSIDRIVDNYLSL